MLIESEATRKARREYDAYAPLYDRETSWYERVMLGDGRAWACAQARGEVLEVAIGTGLNLPFYPSDVRLSGLDLSPRMLALAQARALELNLSAHIVEGDAQALPFPDATFDTVICILGLSSIPDDQAALREMHRVLRHGGHLVLVGHVASPHPPIRAVQRFIESWAATAKRPTDRQTRQTTPHVRQAGFTILYRARSRGGIIERLVAAKRCSSQTPPHPFELSTPAT